MAPDQNSRKIEEIDEECEENEIKKSEEEKDNDKEELSSSFSSNEKEELKNIKLNRYFNIEPDITVKCHTCGQVGHRKDICPNYNIKFCYRCLSSKHEDRDCDKIKCFRCNKLGHKTYNCQLKDNQLIICDRCHCVGHRKNECLIKPMEFSHKFLKYNNLYCLNCGSNKHILCPLINRELPELFENEQDNILFDDSISLNLNNSDNDDDKSSLTPNNEEINQPKEIKKEKKIFDDLDNEDIKYTSFCGFCGGRHRNDECHEKKEDKFNNKFDEQRKSVGKKIIEKREKEKEEEENRRYISSFERNRNNKDNKSYQKNQETKNNKKFNYRFKDKSKSIGINKIINLNEDDPSENENYYNNKNSKNNNKTSKNNNYRNYNKSKSQNKNNKNMKISKFSS